MSVTVPAHGDPDGVIAAFATGLAIGAGLGACAVGLILLLAFYGPKIDPPSVPFTAGLFIGAIGFMAGLFAWAETHLRWVP